MKPEAVIFDFGDTLASLDPKRDTIVCEFLLSKGVSAGPETVADAYRVVDYCNKQSALKLRDPEDKRAFLLMLNAELFKVLGLSRKAQEWAAQLLEYFQERKKWKLFPDVLPLLVRLSETGYNMAVAANWDKGLGRLIEGMGIASYFTSVISSEEILSEKPDPGIFLHAVESLSASPEKTVYVGNEYETDVVGAREAGLFPVLVDRWNLWPHADCMRVGSLGDLHW